MVSSEIQHFRNKLLKQSLQVLHRLLENRDEKTVMRLFIIYYTINQIAANSGVADSDGRHQLMFTSIIQVVASLIQLRRSRHLFTAQVIRRSPAHSEDYHGSGTQFGMGQPLGEAPSLLTHPNPIR